MEKQTWNLTDIWNQQLIFGKKDRPFVKRDRIWASELGKSVYERWLKMNAIEPDFDFDERTLRKFEAGNFFERIVGFVLMSAGILIYDNKWYGIPDDAEHLKVSVKPDFIAGGKPDWNRVKNDINSNLLFQLMPGLGRIAEKLVEYFSEKYPDGLDNLVYEIKSVNSQVFWAKKDYLQEAYPHHQLQCFAELKATNLPNGKILYISKDDLTTAEFNLTLDNKELNELYEKDVREMTKYIRDGIEPPKPENIVFDKRGKIKFQKDKKPYVIIGCYVANWEVEWSNYITKITGIKGKTQADVVEKWYEQIKGEMKDKNDQIKAEFIAKLPDEKTALKGQADQEQGELSRQENNK